ncbi:Fungal specific transcription factor domain-containing protein [Cladophialophora immunda]|nr:Fungal specific transcription factor domain-containing protein [Cladophialophora immunda]
MVTRRTPAAAASAIPENLADPMQLPNEVTQWHPETQPRDDSRIEIRDDAFEDSSMLPFALSAPLQDPMQDFNLFLESIGLSQSWEPEVVSTIESPCLTTDFSIISTSNFQQQGQVEPYPNPRFQNEDAPYSTFGSRLPSLQPESRDPDGRRKPPADEPAANVTSIRNVGKPEYHAFVKRLEGLKDILPTDFALPSRWALSRSFDGFIDGLNEHHPFIHTSTVSIESCSPALTLALAACGSQYRFEEDRGFDFFYASRALLIHSLNRQGGFSLAISATQRGSREWNNIESAQPGRCEPKQADLLENIQALFLLTIFATWGKDRAILQEMLSFQEILASMIREDGLSEDDETTFNLTTQSDDINWRQWVKQECSRRTKLAAFTFFNLHSIMYNRAPLILNADLRLNLPCSSALWKATSADEWRITYEMCCRSGTATGMPFQTSFALLFERPPSLPNNLPLSTPMGNHVLLHGIFQHIFFARQLCTSSPSRRSPSQSLRAEDLAIIEDALRAWKLRWKQTPESSTNPRNPAGPIAFTSTALLGQAYVRSYLDLGPSRALISQDPALIAQSLIQAPPVERTSGLVMALLHAAHALSMPVRLGIDFVARSHSFYWSVQHSLVSLEYAFLLSRWLLALPGSGSPTSMSAREQLLFLWIKRMVDETKVTRYLCSPGNGQAQEQGGRWATLHLVEDEARMRQLGGAIVRIWARTFKGNTCWGVVDIVSQSLESYAALLEQT